MDSPGVADPPPLYSTDAVGRYLNVICCPPGAACESCPSMSVSMERADGSDSHTASAEETNSRWPPSSDAPRTEEMTPQIRSRVPPREKQFLAPARADLLGKHRMYSPRFDVFEHVVSLLFAQVVAPRRVRLPGHVREADDDEAGQRRRREAPHGVVEPLQRSHDAIAEPASERRELLLEAVPVEDDGRDRMRRADVGGDALEGHACAFGGERVRRVSVGGGRMHSVARGAGTRECRRRRGGCVRPYLSVVPPPVARRAVPRTPARGTGRGPAFALTSGAPPFSRRRPIHESRRAVLRAARARAIIAAAAVRGMDVHVAQASRPRMGL